MSTQTDRLVAEMAPKVDLLINQQTQMLELLGRILTKEFRIMATIDDIASAVAAETTVEQSAITLLGQLHDLLVAAQADPVKIQAVIDQLANNQAALAAAITANTPS